MLYIDEQQQKSRSRDSENAQCNLEIAQIFRLCGTYIRYIHIYIYQCKTKLLYCLLQLCDCSYYIILMNVVAGK